MDMTSEDVTKCGGCKCIDGEVDTRKHNFWDTRLPNQGIKKVSDTDRRKLRQSSLILYNKYFLRGPKNQLANRPLNFYFQTAMY